MKNTRQVLLAMMMYYDREFTRQDLFYSTNLELKQIENALTFLKDRRIIRVRHEKTNVAPYRRALYMIDPPKLRLVKGLLKRRA